MKNLRMVIMFLVMSIVLAGNVCAWEQPAPFKIRAIYVSHATNYHFRIYSDLTGWHCSGGPQGSAWSFINETDSGAVEKMNVLKMAYITGKTVQVYTSGVTHSDGSTFCHIEEALIY